MAETTQRTRGTIAVINDDSVFLDMMRDLLQDEGYECETRFNSDYAHSFVRKLQPDLVILDLLFGREMRGWIVLDTLRLDPATSDIPIIICSANSNGLREREEKLQQLGIPWLMKPFDLQELCDAISHTLEGRRPRSARMAVAREPAGTRDSAPERDTKRPGAEPAAVSA